MRSALVLLAAAPLLAFAPLGDKPSFHVAKGAKVVKTFEQSSKLALEDVHLKIGEEEIGRDQMEDFDIHYESQSKLVFTDEYVAVGAGRPELLHRRFDELSDRSVETSPGENGPEETVHDKKSGLDGKTVSFKWNEEQSGFERAFEGDKGDDALLERLVEDCDLRAFLPAQEVADGDTWDVDVENFDQLVNPGGDLALATADEEPDAQERSDQLRKNVTGKIKATYKGTRDEKGAKVAVIALEVEAATHAETDTEGGEGVKAHNKVASEFSFEGELLWDVAAGRPHGLALSGRAKVTQVAVMVHEFDDGSITVEQTIVLGGKLDLSAAYEPAE